MNRNVTCVAGVLIGLLTLGVGAAQAEDENAPKNGCKDLPSWSQLQAKLDQAQATSNGFLKLQMWGTIVDRDGIVCAVAFTGNARGDQWPGSRVISAQKANTGNEFSLPGLSLSTANLYSAVQPGGSLYGLQESNPVATDVAYSGSPSNYGKANDGMVGGRIGGINVFGGGLALYNSSGKLVGGLGVSGDTSCADHNVAWRALPGSSRVMRLIRITSSMTLRRSPGSCRASVRPAGATRGASRRTSPTLPLFPRPNKASTRSRDFSRPSDPGQLPRI